MLCAQTTARRETQSLGAPRSISSSRFCRLRCAPSFAILSAGCGGPYLPGHRLGLPAAKREASRCCRNRLRKPAAVSLSKRCASFLAGICAEMGLFQDEKWAFAFDFVALEQYTRDEIKGLAERHPDLHVYSPPAKEKAEVTPETERNRRSQRKHEAAAVKDWRARMESEAGKTVYRRRKLTEHAHAKMKNRGFGRMLVHGRAKVRCVCLLHAMAHNLLHVQALRRAA